MKKEELADKYYYTGTGAGEYIIIYIKKTVGGACINMENKDIVIKS